MKVEPVVDIEKFLEELGQVTTKTGVIISKGEVYIINPKTNQIESRPFVYVDSKYKLL